MADEKDIAEAAPAGGKKKLLIIIGAALLLVLGGAGGAYFLFSGDEAVDGEGVVQEPEVEEGEPVYHALNPAFVVNLPPGGPAGMLQISIEVMSRTPTVNETLTANDPMIRHHLLNLLEGQQAKDLLTVEGKQALQAEIHTLLNSKLDELKEPGDIKGVFFTQFVMQ